MLEFLLLSPFDDSFVVLDVSLIVMRLKLLVTLFANDAKLVNFPRFSSGRVSMIPVFI